MRVHFIQHVPFETPGYLLKWALMQQFNISYTKVFHDPVFPSADNIDMLIIMGGPMSVYEEDRFFWLKPEKEFTRSVIDAGKKVLGICLGSQLVAEVLGAKIYPNKEKEIGWMPVHKVHQEKEHALVKHLPESFTTFHWHGDTFDLPKGAIHFLQSEACQHQAFLYHNNVIGLQFHMEVVPELVADMVDHGKKELVPGPYIQSHDTILREHRHYTTNNQLLLDILAGFTKK